MNFLCSEEELLSSYKRCRRIGITTSITAPLIVLNGEELERKIQQNKKLINAFHKSIENEWTERQYLFLLVDAEGYLLDVKCSTKEEECIKTSGFNIGVSFKEESYGTNAISMAMKLKRIVYIKPQEHYCDFFKKWHCIACPIRTETEGIIGYIDISTIEKRIAEEMVIVIKLLAEKIANEYENQIKEEELKDLTIRLNNMQVKVLRLLAKGYKELAIAKQLRIGLPTVKYHKKKIIKKLDVDNIQEAVIKAIKLGLIDEE